MQQIWEETWGRKDSSRRISLYWWPQVNSPSSAHLLCQEHFTLRYYILHSVRPSDSLVIDGAQFMNWNGQMFSIYSLSFFMVLHFYIFSIFNKWSWLQSILPHETEKQKSRAKKYFYSFRQFWAVFQLHKPILKQGTRGNCNTN